MNPMWVEYGLSHLNFQAPQALTIGAFDGVHLGHQALIRSMVETAEAQNIGSAVLTFDPLPRQVLQSDKHSLLSTLEERLDFIASLHVGGAVVLPFNHALMSSTAHDFIAQLVEHLNPSVLWIGPDFRFGKDREGDLQILNRAGKQYGFAVSIFQEVVCWQDQPVHSSRIRRALRKGDMDEVNGCLGRPYVLSGVVGHGEKRGRTLGFPTANLVYPGERLLPANGVYIAHAWMGLQRHLTLVNVGTRPTFDHNPITIEAYLLDFSGDLYGAGLRLGFLHRLRPEMKFASSDALVAQMRDDERQARVWFQAHQVF